MRSDTRAEQTTSGPAAKAPYRTYFKMVHLASAASVAQARRIRGPDVMASSVLSVVHYSTDTQTSCD
jgi:hypothetical protein